MSSNLLRESMNAVASLFAPLAEADGQQYFAVVEHLWWRTSGASERDDEYEEMGLNGNGPVDPRVDPDDVTWVVESYVVPVMAASVEDAREKAHAEFAAKFADGTYYDAFNVIQDIELGDSRIARPTFKVTQVSDAGDNVVWSGESLD